MALHSALTGADLHAPGAHKTQHEDGGSDEISLTGLTGAPLLTTATTAVTQSPGDNTTKVATTAFVTAAVASGGVSDGDKGDVVVSSSGTVWTIDSGVVTGSKIASSVALAGSPTTTTQSPNDNSTKIATTAYVDASAGGGSFDLATHEKAQGSPATQDENFNTSLPGRFTAINSGPSTHLINTVVPGAYAATINAGSGTDWKGHVEALPSGDGVYEVVMSLYGRANDMRAGLIFADGSTAGAGNQMWFLLIKVSGIWQVYIQQGTNYAAPGTTHSGGHEFLAAHKCDVVLRAERSGTTWTLKWRDPDVQNPDGQVAITEATLAFTPTFVGFGGFDNVALFGLGYSVHRIRYNTTEATEFGGTVTV